MMSEGCDWLIAMLLQEHNMGRNMSYLAKGCIFMEGSLNADNNNMSYYVYEIY